MAWRTFEISVAGFPPFTLSAASRSKARYEAFLRFSEPYPDVKFGQFAKDCRVTAADTPANDGYDYVRRNYDVDPKVGQRIWLVDEGSSSGRSGTVIYPGQSTAHVHVILDGEAHSSRVHPLSVAFAPPAGSVAHA